MGQTDLGVKPRETVSSPTLIQSSISKAAECSVLNSNSSLCDMKTYSKRPDRYPLARLLFQAVFWLLSPKLILSPVKPPYQPTLSRLP